jgi:hypothetical protein
VAEKILSRFGVESVIRGDSSSGRNSIKLLDHGAKTGARTKLGTEAECAPARIRVKERSVNRDHLELQIGVQASAVVGWKIETKSNRLRRDTRSACAGALEMLDVG